MSYRQRMNSLGHFLVNLPKSAKKIIVLTLDATIAFFATWLAFSLRFNEVVELTEPLLWAASASVVNIMLVFVVRGMYRAINRFAGWLSADAMIRSLLIYAVIYLIIFTVIGINGVPRSIGLLQPILLCAGILVSRVFAKSVLASRAPLNYRMVLESEVLIYGAGVAGRQLASGLRQGNGMRPYAFIDDDPGYLGRSINGMPIYSPNEIPRLLKSNQKITDVLMAMPSVGRARQREILTQLSNLPVHVRILPSLDQLASGVVNIEEIRQVDIVDVLGRDPVPPNEELLHQNIEGKSVLVTGAGGSIGSELCRQILAQKPKILVLFELSEFALYEIERELMQNKISAKIISILGSVLDTNKMVSVIRQFGIQTIYHAAAYKHVPMIEKNPAAGVRNNVFGTLRIVESACQEGVETFVLISTDKAVRPTNIMGCTKRLAELVLQAKSLQKGSSGAVRTKLTMVRFGNVLGSSGSVVPMFKEQIKKGGPVTVTHPEVVRYFMTIPEAAQLVIQAGAMGGGGDVMVLDMGEPVKIFELAKRMIHLSGLTHKDHLNPDGDIEIVYSGLRPGEKLFEELLIGENTLPTLHPRIMRALEHSIPWHELDLLLSELDSVIKVENTQAIHQLLKKAVPEFDSGWGKHF